jgi:hypothetical protein
MHGSYVALATTTLYQLILILRHIPLPLIYCIVCVHITDVSSLAAAMDQCSYNIAIELAQKEKELWYAMARAAFGGRDIIVDIITICLQYPVRRKSHSSPMANLPPPHPPPPKEILRKCCPACHMQVINTTTYIAVVEFDSMQ